MFMQQIKIDGSIIIKSKLNFFIQLVNYEAQTSTFFSGLIFILFFGSFVAFYPTGAPPSKTGSPGDGSNCTECHGGTPSTVAGWITSNIPVNGYTPGQTYQITAI
jgi:hypothetical protein